MIQEAIKQATAGRDLNSAEMEAAMDAIFAGEATAAQVAGLLVALRMKGETAGELAAAARVMRRHLVPVKLSVAGPIVDTCGTGGDGHDTFNISTVASIVLAACGVTVAKHGNRAASSKTGSADVLEALGVDLAMDAERVAACIEQVGIGFMFARVHHPAMKHAAPVRSELGIRTLFNLLGPLTNPAGATHQLLGLGDGSKVDLVAQVLLELGTEGAWVVHGADGLDEVSLAGPTQVAEVRGGEIRRRQVSAQTFGLAPAPLQALKGGEVAVNADIARAILAGEQGPRRDAVVLNCAAALCAAGIEVDPVAAAARAATAIDDGHASSKLQAWVEFSRS